MTDLSLNGYTEAEAERLNAAARSWDQVGVDAAKVHGDPKALQALAEELQAERPYLTVENMRGIISTSNGEPPE